MRMTWIVVRVICLSMVSLWIPSGAGADPTTRQCAGIGDSIWAERMTGTLPQNESTIEKVTKIKNDCPALAGSMDRIANEIKAHVQRQAEASSNVKKVGEKYQNSAYDPGGSDCGSGVSCGN